MSETFVASNGVEVTRVHGELNMEHIGRHHRDASLDEAHEIALRELFLHEAGIWVDPETGAHVYRQAHSDDRDGRCVLVVTPDDSGRFWEKLAGGVGLSKVAARYFAAHPEPKPWHDAKPGELWGVTLKAGIRYDAPSGEELPMQVFLDHTGDGYDSLFFAHWNGPDAEAIDVECEYVATARRIWPEVVSDAA